MRTHFLLLLAALPFAAACGGHGPTPPPSAGTDSLTDIAYLTGTTTHDQYGNSFFYPNTDILVGDEDASQGPNYTVRGIVTFNIKAIPQNANISTANLQLAQCDVVGSPYQSLGSIVVEQIPPITTPDSALYDTAAVNAPSALSSDPTIGFKTANITSSVAADRAAGDTLIQLRLRFSIMDGNNNGADDFAAFSPDSNLATICRPYVTGHRPLLIVSFQ
jgi:hypothetical protein